MWRGGLEGGGGTRGRCRPRFFGRRAGSRPGSHPGRGPCSSPARSLSVHCAVHERAPSASGTEQNPTPAAGGSLARSLPRLRRATEHHEHRPRIGPRPRGPPLDTPIGPRRWWDPTVERMGWYRGREHSRSPARQAVWTGGLHAPCVCWWDKKFGLQTKERGTLSNTV